MVGETLILDPAGDVVEASNFCFLPVVFVTTRVVVMRPGITGALIEAMFRWMALSSSAVRAAKSAADSSSVSGDAAAAATSIRPDPKSNGSAGVVRSSFLTFVIAVSMSADLT